MKSPNFSILLSTPLSMPFFIVTPVTLQGCYFQNSPQIIVFIATHPTQPFMDEHYRKCLLRRNKYLFGLYLDSIWVGYIIVDIFCGNPNNFSSSSTIRFETFLSLHEILPVYRNLTIYSKSSSLVDAQKISSLLQQLQFEFLTILRKNSVCPRNS